MIESDVIISVKSIVGEIHIGQVSHQQTIGITTKRMKDDYCLVKFSRQWNH